MEVSYKQAKRMVAKYLRAGLVPMMKGSPGIGKSAIIQAVAREFNLLVIDLRLAQCDPTDLLGLPSQITYDDGRKKIGYLPMDTFPIEGDPLPINPETGKQYDGWLLFLDELTSAARAVQAAGYKLILDKMVGTKRLHPKVAMAAAGNKETDGAIVEPMSSALKSRIVHMELILNVDEWLEHTFSENWDHRVGDYIKYKRTMLYTFKPDHTDDTYACPRTWEFVNRLLKTVITDIKDPDTRPLIAGAVTEGIAREFITFLKVYKQLHKPEEILANPTGISVPDEVSVIWALTGTLASMAKEDTIGPIMKYVRRLAKEYQVVTLKEMIKRNGQALLQMPPVASWVADNEDIFA